jgi:hypothetical protein
VQASICRRSSFQSYGCTKDALAGPTVADAICDRVLHGAHKLAVNGPLRRKLKEVTSES